MTLTERVRINDGVWVTFRRSGPVDADRVVLVHGGAAHSGWWSGVVPHLAQRRHVVTLDLSGHGESDHRPEYCADLWAGDVTGVLEAVGTGASGLPATLVGHSMGGLVAVATAARFPDQVGRVVLLDTRLPLLELPPPTAPIRFYASAEEALQRFRLLPESTLAEPALLQEVARAGLLETQEGWRWRFDPGARRRLRNAGVRADVATLRCPVGYVYGEKSDMGGPRSVACLEEWLGRELPVEVVADAFHHVPLDRPAGCAAAIESTLERLGARCSGGVRRWP